MFAGARILIAPLDWGLGHSTRDIPIIRRLLELDARPVIGADKGPLALLRDEFPALPWVRIRGVEVRYAKGGSQRLAMATQFPAMLRSLRHEHALLLDIFREQKIDAVISDQRFGLRTAHVPSVLITHQVFPFTPFAQSALRRLNRYQIQRFDKCWIMDEPEAPGLAGTLSHGAQMPANARYIGALSRMRAGMSVSRRYRIAAVISGPEPQRTLLDDALTRQLRAIDGEHLLVRGLPTEPATDRIGNIERRSHMNARDLNDALLNAEHIITRSGYTTLMDLAVLGRSALLIPTPGQSEQEYLAELHQRTGRFTFQRQSELNVRAYVEHTRSTDPGSASFDSALLEPALQELATMIPRNSGA